MTWHWEAIIPGIAAPLAGAWVGHWIGRPSKATRERFLQRDREVAAELHALEQEARRHVLMYGANAPKTWFPIVDLVDDLPPYHQPF